MKKKLFVSLVFASCISVSIVGCIGEDDETGATIKIVNGESGCTLSEVYIYPGGSAKGANLVAGNGIKYNAAPREFEVEGGTTYSVQVSSNTNTSNLDPVAKCSVTLDEGESRVLTYSNDGGPYLFWSVLSGCN